MGGLVIVGLGWEEKGDDCTAVGALLYEGLLGGRGVGVMLVLESGLPVGEENQNGISNRSVSRSVYVG